MQNYDSQHADPELKLQLALNGSAVVCLPSEATLNHQWQISQVGSKYRIRNMASAEGQYLGLSAGPGDDVPAISSDEDVIFWGVGINTSAGKVKDTQLVAYSSIEVR